MNLGVERWGTLTPKFDGRGGRLKSADSTDLKWCGQTGCVEPRARGIELLSYSLVIVYKS